MAQGGDSIFGEARPDPSVGLRLDALPLFPLAEVVHFPHAILPLHIFEPRYKSMAADALAGDRLIAMALPRDDDALARMTPVLHPVVCVGRIIRHERLADGRYHLLLEGQYRAKLLCERPAGGHHQQKPYRVGRLELLRESNGMEIDLEWHRGRLHKLLIERAKHDPASAPFCELMSGSTPTIKIADLLAFHLLENPRLKQAILSDSRVPRRVSRLIDHLQLRWQPLELSCGPSMN